MKNTMLKFLVSVLVIATMIGPFSALAAADVSPNEIPSKKTTEKESTTAKEKDTTKEKTSSSSNKSANKIGLDFSLNMKPAKAKKKVTPKYGLLADGGYSRDGFISHGLSDSLITTNYPATPGAKQKTQIEERIYFVNGKECRVKYEILLEYRQFKEMSGMWGWTQLSRNPTTQVPLGYALATGHLKLSDLPPNVREWHDGGGYDNVFYWPVLNEYSYSADISLELATNLGLFNMSDLTSIQRKALDAGSRFTYMPFKARVFESGIDVNLAIQKGILTRSDLPDEVRKVIDGGGSATYSVSENKYRWMSM